MRKFLVLAAVAAALSMATSAEARNPRDGKGPFFDGNWTPKIVPHNNASKNAKPRRGVWRRPAPKRK